MKPSETPGWHIKLTWGQKVAAYWSISWPAWVASFILVDLFRDSVFVIPLKNLAFFGVQAVLTHRLVRKNYRSFRVDVVRDDGQRSRRLSMREATMVWLWILAPQLAFILILSVVFWGYRAKLPPEIVRGIPSWSVLLEFLVVGPYAVDLALRAKYAGFRLEPYGWRNTRQKIQVPN